MGRKFSCESFFNFIRNSIKCHFQCKNTTFLKKKNVYRLYQAVPVQYNPGVIVPNGTLYPYVIVPFDTLYITFAEGFYA